MAAQQIVEIVKKVSYSIIVDGAEKQLTPEEAIELIKAQGYIKTELDAGTLVDVEGTPFSYKPKIAIFCHGRNMNLSPQLTRIMTELLNRYIRDDKYITTNELLDLLSDYKIHNDTIYARIGDLKKILRTHTGSEIIKNSKQGYYLDFSDI